MTQDKLPRHKVTSKSQSPSEPLQIRFAEPDEVEKLPRAPKAHHKKSRNGCRTCRSRRVKCDEIRPTCGNCERRGIACLFVDADNARANNGQTTSSHASTTVDSRGSADETSSIHGSMLGGLGTHESRTRRQLELRLMHTYNTETSRTIITDDDDVATMAWIYEAPKLALENDALLSAIFSITALHLIDIDTSNEDEMRLVHHHYWHVALREHAQELQCLSPTNFNVTCLTSIYIRLTAMVLLRDRQLHPYTPPTEWFQITRGAMQVFVVAYQWMPTDQNSISSRLTKRMPFIWDEEAKFAASHRERFPHLSAQVGEDALQYTSAFDRDAYEKTISYIGGICIAMETTRGVGPSELCRRLILLPFLTPARFADLVQAAEPRALVILAHFFALLSKYSEYWWVGNLGEREVHVLAEVLPLEWQPLMRWPLDTVSHSGHQKNVEVDHWSSVH